MNNNKYKILSYTSLYPNSIQKSNGIFNKERLEELVNYCEMKIIAPINYLSTMKLFKKAKIERISKCSNIDIFHPRVFNIPIISAILNGLLFYWATLKTVKKLYGEYNFDLIDAHFAYPDGMAAVLMGKYFKKPVVITVHGTDINLFPKYPIIRSEIVYTLKQADKIIAVCEALKNKMVRMGINKDKIIVINNGVNLNKFYPVDKNITRNELKLPLDKKIVLSVGYLIKRKGFHYLIDAINTIIKEHGIEKAPLLIIVGEGSYRHKLEQQISRLGINNNVLLVGAKSHDELYKWYNAADVFALASSREGWPTVFFEAFACGTPAVATNVWGTGEVVKSSDYGILVNKQDSKELAKAIIQAIDTKWNKEKIIAYAKQNTWKNAAEKAYNEFEKVLVNS